MTDRSATYRTVAQCHLQKEVLGFLRADGKVYLVLKLVKQTYNWGAR